MIPQMVRDLSGFLGEVLGIVGNAVENTKVNIVIEQTPDLATECTLFLNQESDIMSLAEARPLAKMKSTKAFMIVQRPRQSSVARSNAG